MKSRLSLTLSLGGLISFTIPVLGHSQNLVSDPMIRVRLNNYSQVPPGALGRAETEAGRILAKAGLRTIWLNCPMADSSDSLRDPCQGRLEGTDVVLRVLSKPNHKKVQDTEFGFAVVPILASVYYDEVMQLATSDAATFETPIILGSVIAHEIGHLLLGLDSHSIKGIMQGRWDRRQIHQAMTGRLLFSEEESQRIRREVIAREESQEPHS